MKAEFVTQFVILKLTFIGPNDDIPPFMVDTYYFVEELPSTNLPPFRDWYIKTMAKETIGVPRNNAIQFCMWKIKSHNSDLFKLKQIRYDLVVLLVGENTIHWIFFKQYGSIYEVAEGTTPLTINYCSCCFNNQYTKFIKNIKENLNANGYSRTIRVI